MLNGMLKVGEVIVTQSNLLETPPTYFNNHIETWESSWSFHCVTENALWEEAKKGKIWIIFFLL